MRWLKFFSIFIFFSSLSPVFAEDLLASFEVKNLQEKMTEAVPFEFEFLFYPVGDRTLEELEDVVKVGDFLKYFYIFEITERRFSQNNQEVYELRGKAVLQEIFRPNEMLSFPFEGKNIYVKYKGPSIEALDLRIKEFALADLKFLITDKSNLKLIISILALLLLVPGIVYGKRIYISIRKKRKRKEEKLRWLENIKKAQTRDDFERIYKERETWLDLIGGKSPESIDLLKKIEEVQYKRDWTEQDIDQIVQSNSALELYFQNASGAGSKSN